MCMWLVGWSVRMYVLMMYVWCNICTGMCMCMCMCRGVCVFVSPITDIRCSLYLTVIHALVSRVEMGNILRRPLEWLQAVFNAVTHENKGLLGKPAGWVSLLLKQV